MYETEQDVIVTDWYQGIAYRKFQTEVYPCAHIKVRSDYEMGISTQDIEITATFTPLESLAACSRDGYNFFFERTWGFPV